MRALRTTFLITALLWTAAGGGAGASVREFDWGFIASRHADVNGDVRFKALGPFFESASSTQDWHLLAVRPFYSAAEDPATDRRLNDWLWPLVTTRQMNKDRESRYGIFFHFNHEVGQAKPRYRWWLLPFYFQGRDIHGESYRALFPLAGSIHEFLGRDEIHFVLFPIRSTSRINELRTSSWIWPIYSRTTGGRVDRFRIFPIYGRSELKDQYRKHFVLWPFWNDVQYFYPGASGRGFILFPLWGHMKLENQETWWLVPPLIRYTHGEKMNLLYLPWPFFQRAHSKDEDKLYLWPLWGHKRIATVNEHFFLWPLGWTETRDRGTNEFRSAQLVPFYFSSSERLKAVDGRKTAATNVYRRVWPLASYRRSGDISRFRVLELWPFAEAPSVERNWEPLWTLYRHDANGPRRQSEFLWGLYRNQRDGDRQRFWSLFPLFTWERDRERQRYRHWSILKGLIGREADDVHARWQMLYFLHWNSVREKKP